MKRFYSAVAAGILSVALSGAAMADDTKTTEIKSTKNTGKKGTEVKTEVTSKNDPAGLGNSTTDSAKVESETKALNDGKTEMKHKEVTEHDAPGIKHDSKKTTKSKVVTDSQGRVIEKEETVK